MTTIRVNNQTVETKPGETILSVCRRLGVKIPTLCHIEELPPSGACRMCLVEVEGMPGLVPSCSYPAADGMIVQTHSPLVVKARRTILELLLGSHPDDCLYCVRNNQCELQALAAEVGVRQRRYVGPRERRELDVSGPSIIRDPGKCILCGKCVRVCEEIQTVASIDFISRGAATFVGTAFNKGLNVSSCVNCGQCIRVCPTGALTERSWVQEVLNALDDPHKTVVVQHAPAVSVTIAEAFGLKPGADVDGQMVAALRRVGFDHVFDTSFSADLTIMEEASELAYRVQTGGILPMMTSCSPAWIKFLEQFFPEFIPNVSTCKSPQQMLGALIKQFWAPRQGLDPRQVVSVSIMPCTAKKFEAARPEMAKEHVHDVDYVLTTRELAQLFGIRGLNLTALEPEDADTPFGERSSAGKIFGASGGVMEAAVRTAHYALTGKELDDFKIQPLRGLQGVKELRAEIGNLEVGAAVVSGLGQARKLLEEVRGGRRDLHFIEVMSCPGGCINGGGQPLGTDMQAVAGRMKALYRIDAEATRRTSHGNPWVKRLYEEFLGAPLSERSHHLLHTHYHHREVVL